MAPIAAVVVPSERRRERHRCRLRRRRGIALRIIASSGRLRSACSRPVLLAGHSPRRRAERGSNAGAGVDEGPIQIDESGGPRPHCRPSPVRGSIASVGSVRSDGMFRASSSGSRNGNMSSRAGETMRAVRHHSGLDCEARTPALDPAARGRRPARPPPGPQRSSCRGRLAPPAGRSEARRPPRLHRGRETTRRRPDLTRWSRRRSSAESCGWIGTRRCPARTA